MGTLGRMSGDSRRARQITRLAWPRQSGRVAGLPMLQCRTMRASACDGGAARALLDENRRFYDLLWSGSRLVQPERFNTWSLVQSLLPASGRRLEVAPGLQIGR